eukprot:5592866-Alexandrium_andersonii.AAC.1
MSASLVGSEMCIRDRSSSSRCALRSRVRPAPAVHAPGCERGVDGRCWACLLYTSDAADDM